MLFLLLIYYEVFTIITVVKNDQNKILKTLKSVFAQTYKKQEECGRDCKTYEDAR